MVDYLRKWLDTLPAGSGPSTTETTVAEFLVAIITNLEKGTLNKDMPVGLGGFGVTGWVTGEIKLCKVFPSEIQDDADKKAFPDGIFVIDTERKPSCILMNEAQITDL